MSHHSTLQRTEQEPHPPDRGSNLSGFVEPRGAQTSKEQHQQTDRRSFLGPGQNESPVCIYLFIYLKHYQDMRIAIHSQFKLVL